MSDAEVKPTTLDPYNGIRKLSSPNDESNWDTWSFAMRMMLRGKNLEYVIEGGYKEGYNGTTAILPDAASRTDNRLVSSIITSRVDEDNFTVIEPCQDSAKRMWRALSSAHQNNTAGGRYMYLRSMMTTRAGSDDEVTKLIGTMDVIRQRLLNVCPDGNISINDLYVSSLISALPESWTSVTSPLELQAHVSPGELKRVLRGHIVKLKNQETSSSTASVALSATTSSKKSKSQQPPPRPDCDYCKRKGHSGTDCHRKQMDEQRREIESLKQSIKNVKSSKSARVAHVLESESDLSVEETQAAKSATSSSHIKFSRAAAVDVRNVDNDLFTYNADTGCTDTLVQSKTRSPPSP